MFRNYPEDATGFAGGTPAAAPPSGRTGRPPVTSRAEILGAARRLIDRDGWARLTMRGLATELGVGPTTLYRNVRDKEDLLLLLLNEYAGNIARPRLPKDPRRRVVAAATALHDALSAWPWAAEVLTADGFVGLLDERALWTVETIVAGSVDAGATPEQGAAIFRSIWYYTVGEILVRSHSARARADGTRRAPAGRFFGGVDAARLPHLAALGDKWPALAAQDTYPEGLRAFVAGLLDRPGQPAGGASRSRNST